MLIGAHVHARGQSAEHEDRRRQNPGGHPAGATYLIPSPKRRDPSDSLDLVTVNATTWPARAISDLEVARWHRFLARLLGGGLIQRYMPPRSECGTQLRL